jgi:lactate dehydrogenase-like 2-hydroxyacid dehydrogenase
MNVVAWSENLTAEAAESKGARLVRKDELFAMSDYLSIHVRLSARTEHIVAAAQFAQMKPTARLINTSRAPIVDNAALLKALTGGKIAGAALDVFDVEPVKQPHPDAAPWICIQGIVPDLLRRYREQHRQLAWRATSLLSPRTETRRRTKYLRDTPHMLTDPIRDATDPAGLARRSNDV